MAPLPALCLAPLPCTSVLHLCLAPVPPCGCLRVIPTRTALGCSVGAHTIGTERGYPTLRLMPRPLWTQLLWSPKQVAVPACRCQPLWTRGRRGRTDCGMTGCGMTPRQDEVEARSQSRVVAAVAEELQARPLGRPLGRPLLGVVGGDGDRQEMAWTRGQAAGSGSARPS